MQTDTRPAWQRSAELRRERARLREHVQNGGSLTILIREGRCALESVELRRLVSWMPYTGPVKTSRLLIGLPARYKLGMLRPPQRAEFIQRIEQAERNRYQED